MYACANLGDNQHPTVFQAQEDGVGVPAAVT